MVVLPAPLSHQRHQRPGLAVKVMPFRINSLGRVSARAMDSNDASETRRRSGSGR